ncbi:MAG: outer membrane beta-barrel protein [Kiritimatiellae bacterium]|nr:outer membrane beta-barrel protein [Kiritimatiellia bacterium]
MNAKFSAFATAMVVSASVLTVSADVVDRPSGFKIGERMTLRPYVSLSYTYDSNVDSAKHAKDGSTWVVNPGLGAEYKGDNWEIAGRAWYRYHAYNRYSNQLNESSFGENLSFKWADSLANEKGWSVLLTESFTQIAQDDDMSDHSGRGIGRDRKTFQAAGIIERRINEHLHAAIDASYYMLDYENNVKDYAPLYGWKRALAGGEIGYAASKWTDFLLAANYGWYWQDNVPNNVRYSDESRGWTVMAGFGTRATEKIEYRILTGWSRFEYADGDADDIDGWTYQVSGKWKITDTWNMMLLAASYYQPSEREMCSAIRVDSISWGVAHSMIRGKLNATFDLNYRRETHEYSYTRGYDYDDDIITARLGLNYTLNRFLQIYGRLEYQTDMCDGGDVRGHNYDYDRFRGTVGMRLTY